ncbi:MAG TPA: recombinase family protein [Acidobacteriaceae bacterium]
MGIYCRVSTTDQQTLPMQEAALREYAEHRGWEVVKVVAEKRSGAKTRPQREALLQAARRREIDVIAVWKLDRWGRSLADLVTSLEELIALGIVFVSYTEAIDLSTPSGRAMAGMLSVFSTFERDVIRERVLAGQAYARSKGVQFGPPRTSSLRTDEVLELHQQNVPKAEIARRLEIPRTSVIRIIKDAA